MMIDQHVQDVAMKLRYFSQGVIAFVLAIMLVGCGGSDSAADVDQGSVRYYSTLYFQQNQLLALMSFDGGLIYGFYQPDLSIPVYPDFAYAGFFVVKRDSSTSPKNRVGTNFDFDAHARTQVSLLNVDANDLRFTATLQSGLDSIPLQGERSLVDQSPTDTSLLPGTYGVQARSVRGGLKGSASVNADGSLRVDLPNGCSIDGVLSSRPIGGLYDALANMPGSCSLGSGQFNGLAFQNQSTRFIYIFLTSASNDGVMLLLVSGG